MQLGSGIKHIFMHVRVPWRLRFRKQHAMFCSADVASQRDRLAPQKHEEGSVSPERSQMGAGFCTRPSVNSVCCSCLPTNTVPAECWKPNRWKATKDLKCIGMNGGFKFHRRREVVVIGKARCFKLLSHHYHPRRTKHPPHITYPSAGKPNHLKCSVKPKRSHPTLSLSLFNHTIPIIPTALHSTPSRP